MVYKNGKKIKVCKYCGEEGHTQFQCKKRAYDKLKENRSKLVLDKKITKNKSISERRKIINDLDRVFSTYIRTKQFKKLKFNVCFTCGKILKYSDSMACHFIPRRYIATRFDEDNVKVGCIVCNDFKNGNLKEFEKRLGPEIVEKLNQKKNQRISTYQLKEMLEDYKKKLKEL